MTMHNQVLNKDADDNILTAIRAKPKLVQIAEEESDKEIQDLDVIEEQTEADDLSHMAKARQAMVITTKMTMKKEVLYWTWKFQNRYARAPRAVALRARLRTSSKYTMNDK